MIISASRRTDIPAFYSEWFLNRLKAGEVLVPNPYNRKKVSRIALSPDVIDCISFWTKNPAEMMPRLKEIDHMGYKYYFQMTVTDYGKDMEIKLPSIEDSMASFILLSERIGKERVDWRFDPILLTEDYTIEYHLQKFEMMCRWLHKYTTRCIISFVDAYKNSPFLEMEAEDMEIMAAGLSQIGKKYDLPIYTCAEQINLEQYGIQHGACIDKKRIEELVGYKLDLKKDAGQRKVCGCVESVDVGTYDTCTHGCRYCYASASLSSAMKKHEQHDPQSPLLLGHLQGDEQITDRSVHSDRDIQLSLFDL